MSMPAHLSQGTGRSGRDATHVERARYDSQRVEACWTCQGDLPVRRDGRRFAHSGAQRARTDLRDRSWRRSTIEPDRGVSLAEVNQKIGNWR